MSNGANHWRLSTSLSSSANINACQQVLALQLLMFTYSQQRNLGVEAPLCSKAKQVLIFISPERTNIEASIEATLTCER